MTEEGAEATHDQAGAVSAPGPGYWEEAEPRRPFQGEHT